MQVERYIASPRVLKVTEQMCLVEQPALAARHTEHVCEPEQHRNQ